jgi:hypothetical protein
VCSMQNTSGDGREQVMVVSPPALERADCEAQLSRGR